MEAWRRSSRGAPYEGRALSALETRTGAAHWLGYCVGADFVSSNSGTGARPWRMREVLQERRSQLGVEPGC